MAVTELEVGRPLAVGVAVGVVGVLPGTLLPRPFLGVLPPLGGGGSNSTSSLGIIATCKHHPTIVSYTN